ncbi:MAG: hypothetical protein SFY32_07760 [Bacteroidota bacterium]|nr:hypothetical protein [Bacteroidota bacterium]
MAWPSVGVLILDLIPFAVQDAGRAFRIAEEWLTIANSMIMKTNTYEKLVDPSCLGVTIKMCNSL